jgi:hypothetical protein
MAATYSFIAKYVVTAATQGPAILAFTSLGNYTDLVMKISSRNNNPSIAGNILLYLNGASSGYSNIFVQGSGSGTWGSGTVTRMVGDMNTASSASGIFNNIEVYIPNYLSALNKTFNAESVTEETGTQAYSMLSVNTRNNTEALTSIGIEDRSGYLYVQGTSFYLYGIKNT